MGEERYGEDGKGEGEREREKEERDEMSGDLFPHSLPPPC